MYLNNTLSFGVDAAQVSDYINICGNNSNLCSDPNNPLATNKSISANEGFTKPVFLHATIVGDPEIILQDLTAPTDQNGFIGSDPPLSLLVAVPEPASWTILIIGLGFIVTLNLARAATVGGLRAVRTPSPIRANAAQ